IKVIETEPIGKKYNIKLINEHLGQDLEMLNLLLRKVKGVKRDKKLDKVIESLQEDDALKRRRDMSGKVLIFSEYAATVRYITKVLKDEFDGKTIDCITGDTKPEKRMEIIKRFSPKSNQTEGDVIEGKDIDILVSTEVLSEGQNLQDCNYVINYDLPWNPMRIVQRTGRIDRLASTFKVIHTRACFPDEELDKILKLVGKVIGKIKTANETVGLDGELLGETPNKKQYNGTIMGRIKVLSKSGEGTNGLIEDLEREADIMPQTTPMSEISRYVKEKGIEFMQEIPMGRRTGKNEEKGDRAILAYLQEKPNRRIYFVRYNFRTQKADVPDDKFDAIRDIRCAVNTPTHLPMDNVDHQKSFELLLQIDEKSRIAIREKNDYATKSGNVSNEFSKISDEIKNVIVDAENISIDDGEAVDLILDSGYAKPWTDKLKGFFTDYKRDKNVDVLIFKIKELGKDIGVEKSKKIKSVEIQQGEPDLKLVGAMLITGKKFDGVSFNNLYTHMNT
ncbi:MAG: C-terminal helicase domain-containing protein, partial [Thaumarchaeota archaeon]|nr:C-terminal helicase domain-containing protein [Nitrososphaerota archaeon]